MVMGKWFLNDLKLYLSTCKHISSVAKIHAVAITSGIFGFGSLPAQLIASYARAGHMDVACKLLDNMPERRVDSWNALLIAYSRRNCPLQLMHLYRRMIFENIKPDSSTFTVAIKACTSLMDLELGQEIWRTAVGCGYGDDIFVATAVLNLYAKSGEMDGAMCVFERMCRRDVVTWSTVIAGFVKSGRAMEAVDAYRAMRKEGLEGDGVVMLALIQACAEMRSPKIGCSLHGYMLRKGYAMDVAVQTTLVDMYAKSGRVDSASTVFRIMSHRSIVSWSSLISGYARSGRYAGESLKLLVEMQSCGLEPDLVSLVSALLACSQLGSPSRGREVHGYITRRRIRMDQDEGKDEDQVLSTALIDMYAKCGLLCCARALCEQVSSFRRGDVILWNTIIASYGTHGEGKEALKIFRQMLEAGVAPDHATFAALLSALSHSGLVEEGKYWFESMVEEYGIEPMEKHYVSLVDLFARGGRVEEARELIEGMMASMGPPGMGVWVALLSGCLNHKKFGGVGEWAARKVLLELKGEGKPPKQGSAAGVYSLVSNFFAAAKRWEEVAAVRREMRLVGGGTVVKKAVPGCSVIEVNGRLSAFSVEDRSHPWYGRIAAVVAEMEDAMRRGGGGGYCECECECECECQCECELGGSGGGGCPIPIPIPMVVDAVIET
ncbi:putative pentatricopeptide repeat-containing protein At3g25060, mitochondrial [Andrographis paniculata]|uniref:putative pentatricopeptide repeat-containing protein At3g25060, mitochondrial n=1 Tax=Andrographis paniculata TaxID=175694 RepID=UPI0021E9329A|nr:putative pentatricopeptide repeat-containing protein At3g25060, mitochondrial [Andrographis paniculata]